jgi:calcium-dependent protein kinase
MGNCFKLPKQNPIKIHVRDKIVDRAGSLISIHSVYRLGKSIGLGTFGVVKIGHNLSNPKEKVAVKIIFKDKLNASTKRLRDEIDILLTLDHPNIIKCYETFEDENSIYMVMEFCSGGELIEIFPIGGAMEEKLCLEYIIKVLMAVSHIHRIGIVHRDLKPENFIFSTRKSTQELKLVDFGLSNKFSNKFDKLHSTVGTPFYVAPEVLRGTYDSKCDLWSVGVMLFAMLSGELPFYANNVTSVFRKIESGCFKMNNDRWESISEETKHLVTKLLCLNTHDRLSANEALEHPAIHKIPPSLTDPFEFVNKLDAYSKLSFIKRFIMSVIVKFLDFDKISEQRKAFSVFDKNLTGIIQVNEICDILEDMKVNFSQHEISSIMNKIGIRHKGKLCFSEFISILTKFSDLINKEIIRLTFEFFDKDRDGSFNTKDYIDALDIIGDKITIEESETHVKEISDNGVVKFEDFRKFIISL